MARIGILAALAALIACPAPAQTPPGPQLQQALRDHADYSLGFRTKFRTGYYAVAAHAASDPAGVIRRIAANLDSLSQERETLALIHHVGRDGTMRAWLLDRTGLIASANGGTPRLDLAFLHADLEVVTRAGARSPTRVGQAAPAAALPAAPERGYRSREVALTETSGSALPDEIRAVLSRTQGRLLVLPAANTALIPYAALPLDDDRPLAARWSVVLVPDLETLTDAGRRFDAAGLRLSSALLVGDPDLGHDRSWRWPALPGARSEIVAVAEMLGVSGDRLLIGDEASRDAVLSRVDGYGEADLIYFATHAIADPDNPMDGGFIALAEGHLYGRDLRGRRLEVWGARHPLVVLSACQTALGRTFAGGTFGIARAFVSAGAGQVVASLWNVNDLATADLMTAFARQLADGEIPEEALRRAQLETWERYPDDPAAWASFVTFGAPSGRPGRAQ